MSAEASAALAMSIAAVERDTGLSKDTLRVWERRYGFPVPARDALGERRYPLEQVEKLRLLKRLLDMGHRPGRIADLPVEELKRLAQAASGSAARAVQVDDRDDLGALIESLTAHRLDELRGQMSQLLLRKGLARFVTEVVAPLNERVGEGWTRGEVQIFEEHLYTEVIQGLLRNAINTIPRHEGRPRVLLTTLPQEPHGLGLLMAEAVLALEGSCCISLGVQTPVLDVVRAAQAQRADIVALSFSGAANPNQVLSGLIDLREKLPQTVQVWAGGDCKVLHRRTPPGIFALQELDEIAPALQRWRRENG